MLMIRLCQPGRAFRTMATLLLCSIAVLSGCSDPYANEKQCFKIVGKITVDGKPASGLQLSLHSAAGIDQKQPTFPQGQTDADGNIKFSTYADGDGAPAGDYKMTASWQDFNVMARSFSGPDKLKKKYSDPEKTPLTITIKNADPNDIGTIELSTK